MKSLANLFAEVLWLGGAGAFAFFFLKTFLAIEVVALVITLALIVVERNFR